MPNVRYFRLNLEDDQYENCEEDCEERHATLWPNNQLSILFSTKPEVIIKVDNAGKAWRQEVEWADQLGGVLIQIWDRDDHFLMRAFISNPLNGYYTEDEEEL